MFSYPPFCEMVELEYRHKEEKKAFEFCQKLMKKMELVSQEKNIQFHLNPKSFKKNNSDKYECYDYKSSYNYKS